MIAISNAISIGLNKVGGGSTPFVGLLDLYPNAAAAYSLRRLNRNYNGSAIRVRRTDLTEQNIGFDANGNLDTAALLSFVGTGALDNGFVTTWYDQSGNGNNLVQSTAISQPKIVNAGSIITQNSKPSILFDGINDFFIKTFTIASTMTRFSVFNHLSPQANTAIMFDDGTNSDTAYLNFSTTSTLRMFNGSNLPFSGIVNNNQLYVSYNLYNGSSSGINVNNITPSTGSLQVKTYNGVSVGSRGGSNIGFYTNMYLPELIIYPSNQSSNRTGIAININSYYDIY